MTTNPERSDLSKRDRDTSEELSGGQFFLEMVKVFLLAAVIIIPVRVFLFQPFFVQGSSMVPNFENGEYLVVNELGFKQTEVGLPGQPIFTVPSIESLPRQQPIVFRSPQEHGIYLIKRVIGLPGETVRIEHSKIIIENDAHPDGFVLDESSYLAPSVLTTDMKPLTLGHGQYFVLGDNRMNSLDSRVFGAVDRKLVVGRVLLRAWPLSRAAWYR
ncbi:MAG TPA: signal peptidase I [Candidatus Fimivivens sp.]|nr:signal peptidase I [Candidatus Fimivivens sp.]